MTTSKQSLPSFLPELLEPQIQSCPEILKLNKLWFVTEELAGSAATYFLKNHKCFFFKKYEFGVCSKNFHLVKYDDSIYWKIAEKYQIREILEQKILNYNWIAIQGEIIAPKIEGNIYQLTKPQFKVHTVLLPDKKLNFLESIDFCEGTSLSHAPLLLSHEGIDIKTKSIRDLLNMATGESVLKENVLRKGLLFKSLDGEDMFKVISPLYAMQHPH